jgi:uncharacterized membrane protein
MDPNVELALVGLVTFLVTAGIKGIAKQFGWNIEGKVSVLVVAVVASCVLLAKAGFALIPADYQPVAGSVVTVIVTVLTAAGIYKTTKQ